MADTNLDKLLQDVLSRLRQVENQSGVGMGALLDSLQPASENRTSTSYGDLTTPGPETDIDIFGSGKLLIGITCRMNDFAGFMGYLMTKTGSTQRNPNDNKALYLQSQMQATAWFLETGLTPGVWHIKARYRSADGSDVNFENRHLLLIPV